MPASMPVQVPSSSSYERATLKPHPNPSLEHRISYLMASTKYGMGSLERTHGSLLHRAAPVSSSRYSRCITNSEMDRSKMRVEFLRNEDHDKFDRTEFIFTDRPSALRLDQNLDECTRVEARTCFARRDRIGRSRRSLEPQR